MTPEIALTLVSAGFPLGLLVGAFLRLISGRG